MEEQNQSLIVTLFILLFSFPLAYQITLLSKLNLGFAIFSILSELSVLAFLLKKFIEKIMEYDKP